MRAWPTTSPRASSSGSSAGAALLLLVLASGCEAWGRWFADDRPIVYVDIRERDPALANAVPRAAIEAAMKEVLLDLPGYAFRSAKPGEVPHQIGVVVEQVTERSADPVGGHGSTQLRRSVGVSLELFATSGDRRRVFAEALEVEEVPRGQPIDGLVMAAVKKAGRELKLALLLEAESDQGIVQLLGSADPSRRGRAVLIAGARRLKAARPALEALLKDADRPEAEVLAVIGALVQIGDPESVTALIDCGRERGNAYTSPIIFAVAQLGGKEAQAYLFTLESGHPDPQVREVAKQALKELESRPPPPKP